MIKKLALLQDEYANKCSDKIGGILIEKMRLCIAFTLQNSCRNFFDIAVYIGDIDIYKVLDHCLLLREWPHYTASLILDRVKETDFENRHGRIAVRLVTIFQIVCQQFEILLLAK